MQFNPKQPRASAPSGRTIARSYRLQFALDLAIPGTVLEGLGRARALAAVAQRLIELVPRTRKASGCLIRVCASARL
jgi:hypothetical protein